MVEKLTFKPVCRTCGVDLVVIDPPLGFLRRGGDEWEPVSGSCSPCDLHPSDPPLWKETQ